MNEIPHITATPPLEDNWLDILEKARKGLGMDRLTLCQTFDEDAVVSAARALNLDVRGILAIARGQYAPAGVEIPGLKQIPTPFPQPGYPQGTANAYVVQVPGTKDAVLFDAGTTPDLILGHIEANGLRLVRIFITHTHHDHIGGLPTLHSLYPQAPVMCHKTELVADFMTQVADGEIFTTGTLRIEARHTPGHSKGGMCYCVQGLEKPLAFTGDALFAGSAGNAPGNWRQALETVRDRILSLPPETILCPGHGPLTTVAYERANNPMFAKRV